MPPQYEEPSPHSGQPQPGTVEVGPHAPGIAVVTMLGEHDISTEPQLAQAIAEASAHSDVVVDLSGCTFIDSTVIASLINGAAAVHARGERFALVIPPEQRHVTRIARMIRLSEFLAVHDSRDAALASLEAGEAPG
jgi:anti-sigma B factor antagonist